MRPRDAEHTTWTVNAIVDHRVGRVNGEINLYYKIKWSPRGAHPNSWEPADNCQICETAVAEYWEVRAFEQCELDIWP